MTIRRVCALSIVVLTVAVLTVLAWRVLAPGGWTPAKLVMLVAFGGAVPWTAVCMANGLIGFVILIVSRDPVRTVFPVTADEQAALPLTAIAMTVRNEDMLRVLPPLRRLLRELDLAGAADAFTVFILSDTQVAQAVAGEKRAVAAFRAADRDPTRVRYRRRSVNNGFKAGNILDFLDRHGDAFELMLVLDADSAMSATAVLRLVRALQADPTLAIAQHLTVGLPASSAFPRLFQFGMRAGMRTWATGQAWWQAERGPYWGHNALVRIAPFRTHCRLPTLPDGRHILSHDQLEAAVLSGAGWGVRVLPDEDGSWEANPPALPEFLRRELRWLAGNLQYCRLLRLPGLRPIGRWHLIQAIMLFATTPFHLLFLAAAAAAAATDVASPFPASSAIALTAAWLGALYAPKLFGYVEVVVSPEKRRGYGGLAQLAGGIAAEIGFTLLLDAVSAVAKCGGLIRLAFGARVVWIPQNRGDRSVSWCEATRLLWPQTLIGLLVFGGFAAGGVTPTLWALPLAGGLLMAIPLCVLTADPRVGRWLRERQVAAVPEEISIGIRRAARPQTEKAF